MQMSSPRVVKKQRQCLYFGINDAYIKQNYNCLYHKYLRGQKSYKKSVYYRTVYSFDVTAAKKLFSGVAKTTTKSDYGAQADIPKLVSSTLEIAAKDLSDQIAKQVYEKSK